MIVGGPQEVAGTYRKLLDLGVDGFTANMPANGHIPGRVSLLGDTLAPLIAA